MSTPAPLPSLQLDTGYRQIIRMSLPISLAILIPQLNFITNNVFLGHYADGHHLGVAGLTGVYYLIFAAIGYGLNNGLQALISRRAGENRPDEIGRLFNQGVLIGMGLAIAGMLLTWLLVPTLYRLFISDEQLLAEAVSFLNIRVLGLPFLYVYQLRNALLVGTNQSKYLVAGTLAETLANVLFDYLLIYGKLGLPALGFNGAAVASVIAEFTGMFVIYLVIHRKGIGRRFALFSSLRFQKDNNRLILQMSAPLMFQHGISIVSWQFFFLLMSHHGNQALQISNAMRNFFGFFGSFTWAFAATSNAMVANVIGQGREDWVRPLLGRIIRLSLGFSLLVFVLVNAVPQAILAIYGQDASFVAAAMPVVRVVTVAMLLMSFSTVYLNAVTGTGQSRVTFAIELFAIVMYCAYVYLVVERWHLSVAWGWISEWVYWISLFVPAWWYIRSGRWQGRVV